MNSDLAIWIAGSIILFIIGLYGLSSKSDGLKVIISNSSKFNIYRNWFFIKNKSRSIGTILCYSVFICWWCNHWYSIVNVDQNLQG